MPNIFADIPTELPEELIEVLCENCENSDLRIERIVSRGQSSPEGFWYDSDKNEWVILLKGSAAILFENCGNNPAPLELQPGDYLNIPAHTKHRVERTDENEDSVWLAIHYG